MKHGLIKAITGLLFAFSVNAYAVPTFNISGQGLVTSTAAEDAFLSTLASGYITESFESFAAPTLTKNLDTSVGSFSQVVAGVGGACKPNCDKGVAVLTGPTSPFSGRYAIDGSKWLDSWDSQHLNFTLNQAATHVGFYLTDPNDVGGRLSLKLKDGADLDLSLVDVIGGAQTDGRVFYLSFFAVEGIKEINFFSNHKADGFGIDKVTIGYAKVSEPATLAIASLGLIGLAFARRRRV
jgi:hypothetical protein